MRYLYTTLVLLLLCNQSFAQEVTRRVIVLGNTNEAVKDDPGFFNAVRNSVPFDSNTIVLYLGNYTNGSKDTTGLRMQAEIIAGTEAKAFFVPGFEDWADGDEGGYKAVLKQEKFLERLGNGKNIKLYPGDACSGPKEIDLGNDAKMIIMNSQWWLHEHSKPDIGSDCKFRSKDEVLAEIEDLPKDNYDKLMLFVTYHPLNNTGVHSGSYGLKQHIFPLTDLRGAGSLYLPLPIVGSLYPIMRNSIVSKQDMNNSSYQVFTTKGIRSFAGVKRAFKDHPNTIFIAGQEHSLQLIREDKQPFIVSGAAGVPRRARNTNKTEYVHSGRGFTVIEITKDKKAKGRFFEIENNVATEAYTTQLADYEKLPPLEDTGSAVIITSDSFTAAVDKHIANAGGLKRKLVGENYRKEWGTEVKMPVLNMATEKGGLKVTGVGGGHESKSLQMEDASGKKWVLRSMNKNLEAVIPEGFHGTLASSFIHDILSGTHPYGAFVVPALQKPLNIVHASPELFYVPNDTALGYYGPLFANNVGQLEERKPALNDNDLVGTTEAFNDMVDHSDHLSDQEAYLKTRLVDFLIADFDRHHGQYTWGYIDTAGRKKYYPVPKDRDQALYHNTGPIISFARVGAYKFMVNFPHHIKHITHMGITSEYVDRVFLNKLSADDWQQTLTTFDNTLTDSVLKDAVHRMPPEIYAIRGSEISDKLSTRRDDIVAKGMEYYEFISKQVSVLGGNKDDVFKVSGNRNNLQVQVYAKDSSGAEQLRYERWFDPAVTKEIRLWGFNGNDRFEIDPKTRSSIRLQIVGGKGKDTFDIKGNVRNLIYDQSLEKNAIISHSHTTKMFGRKPNVNNYEFREMLHNSFSLPAIAFGVNADDGFLAGIQLGYKTYGFRKYPYATNQTLSGLIAPSNRAYNLKYRGDFVNVYRHYGLNIRADHSNPVLSNFYGFGNETMKDSLKAMPYYNARYDFASADVLVRRRFLNDSIMSFSIGPSIYNYWCDAEPNRNKILERPSMVGLDSAGVYSQKIYGGGKAILTIRNLNSDLLPTRGIDWTTEFTALQGLNKNAKGLTRLVSNLNLYAVLSEPAKLLATIHLGGGHIFSNNAEYFQAVTLGGDSYLRGYRASRFAGSSMVYGSTELKVKLFDVNTYVVKGDFGLVGFNDIGRVWVKNDASQKWHHGYGGGVYFVPFNTLMLSFVSAFSEEDQLFNLTLGTKLNMLFQGNNN